MTRTAQTTAPATQPTGDDYDLAHIVNGFQHLLDRLHLKIPRALCGELLIGDPDRPGPTPNSPICPRCEAKAAK